MGQVQQEAYHWKVQYDVYIDQAAGNDKLKTGYLIPSKYS